MKRIILVILLSTAAGALVAAQLYRWVDDKGNVEYRDTPPPKGAKKVEEQKVRGYTAQPSTPSYSTQQAAKNFPVTLWAFDCGDPCTQARALLARRGVPYTEKDPKEDVQAFQKLTGGTGAPVLYVGTTRLTGFLEGDWENALDIAGYPKTAAASGVKPAAKPAAKPGTEQKPPLEEKPVPAGAVPAAPGAPPAPQPSAQVPSAGK